MVTLGVGSGGISSSSPLSQSSAHCWMDCARSVAHSSSDFDFAVQLSASSVSCVSGGVSDLRCLNARSRQREDAFGVVRYAALEGVYAVACKLIWVRAGERTLHRGIETMQRR